LYEFIREHKRVMKGQVVYASALRKGEILNLTWMDVDFQKQQSHNPGKGMYQTHGWEKTYYLAVSSEDVASASRIMNEILADVKTD